MIQAAPAAAFVPNAPLNTAIVGRDVLAKSQMTEYSELKEIIESNPQGRELCAPWGYLEQDSSFSVHKLSWKLRQYSGSLNFSIAYCALQ